MSNSIIIKNSFFFRILLKKLQSGEADFISEHLAFALKLVYKGVIDFMQLGSLVGAFSRV